MTGHRLTMKTVGIAELKARLSAYLKVVRKGHPVVVMDRGAPVARIVPLGDERELVVRKPLRALHSVKLPARPTRGVDSVALLLEERERER